MSTPNSDRISMLAAAMDAARTPSPVSQSKSRHQGHAGKRMHFLSAETGRLTGDWPTTPVPIDWIIRQHQRTLVARSREQANSNDFMKAYLRLNRQNIVGSTGIQLRSLARTARGAADTEARRAIEASFAKWGVGKHCDVAGKLTWRATCAQAAEAMARDGEFIFRVVTGTRRGGAFGFALQGVDPQRCPVDFDRNDMDDGNFIRSGIEYDGSGRPQFYYFQNSSTRDSALAYSYAGRNYERVPAEDVIHGFVAEMTGQKRGLPWASTGLFRAKQTSAMEDAAVVNARSGAAKMGFIQFAAGEGPEYDEDTPLEIDAEAGTFPILPSGAEFKEFAPQYPSGEFAPFVKQMLRGFCAGGGVSYASLSQDLEGVNFSSIRQGETDTRETYKERQEVLIDELCEAVFPRFLKWALMTSNVVTEVGAALRVDALDRCMPHAWQPRRWSYIDPRADWDAAETSKNNLLSSPGQLIRDQGRDPQQVWREIGEDIKTMRSEGIPDEIIAMSLGQKLAPKIVENSPGTSNEI